MATGGLENTKVLDSEKSKNAAIAALRTVEEIEKTVRLNKKIREKERSKENFKNQQERDDFIKKTTLEIEETIIQEKAAGKVKSNRPEASIESWDTNIASYRDKLYALHAKASPEENDFKELSAFYDKLTKMLDPYREVNENNPNFRAYPEIIKSLENTHLKAQKSLQQRYLEHQDKEIQKLKDHQEALKIIKSQTLNLDEDIAKNNEDIIKNIKLIENLKKPPATKSEESPKEDLLAAIRAGLKLRKTQPKSAPPSPEKAEPSGLIQELQKFKLGAKQTPKSEEAASIPKPKKPMPEEIYAQSVKSKQAQLEILNEENSKFINIILQNNPEKGGEAYQKKKEIIDKQKSILEQQKNLIEELNKLKAVQVAGMSPASNPAEGSPSSPQLGSPDIPNAPPLATVVPEAPPLTSVVPEAPPLDTLPQSLIVEQQSQSSPSLPAAAASAPASVSSSSSKAAEMMQELGNRLRRRKYGDKTDEEILAIQAQERAQEQANEREAAIVPKDEVAIERQRKKEQNIEAAKNLIARGTIKIPEEEVKRLTAQVIELEVQSKALAEDHEIIKAQLVALEAPHQVEMSSGSSVPVPPSLEVNPSVQPQPIAEAPPELAEPLLSQPKDIPKVQKFVPASLAVKKVIGALQILPKGSSEEELEKQHIIAHLIDIQNDQSIVNKEQEMHEYLEMIGEGDKSSKLAKGLLEKISPKLVRAKIVYEKIKNTFDDGTEVQPPAVPPPSHAKAPQKGLGAGGLATKLSSPPQKPLLPGEKDLEGDIVPPPPLTEEEARTAALGVPSVPSPIASQSSALDKRTVQTVVVIPGTVAKLKEFLEANPDTAKTNYGIQKISEKPMGYSVTKSLELIISAPTPDKPTQTHKAYAYDNPGNGGITYALDKSLDKNDEAYKATLDKICRLAIESAAHGTEFNLDRTIDAPPGRKELIGHALVEAKKKYGPNKELTVPGFEEGVPVLTSKSSKTL